MKQRNRCYKGRNEWKEIDFNKEILEKPNQNWLGQAEEAGKQESVKGKGHYETKKVVRLIQRPNGSKMEKRKCISEHLFGMIKRAMNLLGFEKLMQMMA